MKEIFGIFSLMATLMVVSGRTVHRPDASAPTYPTYPIRGTLDSPLKGDGAEYIIYDKQGVVNPPTRIEQRPILYDHQGIYRGNVKQ
jgi:hypothetical protein